MRIQTRLARLLWRLLKSGSLRGGGPQRPEATPIERGAIRAHVPIRVERRCGAR